MQVYMHTLPHSHDLSYDEIGTWLSISTKPDYSLEKDQRLILMRSSRRAKRKWLRTNDGGQDGTTRPRKCWRI